MSTSAGGVPQPRRRHHQEPPDLAGYVPVRLPLAVAPLFEDWLSRHYPDRKDKILNRIRSIRGGKLNESTFHARMRGHGPFSEQMSTLFDVATRKAGIDGEFPGL